MWFVIHWLLFIVCLALLDQAPAILYEEVIQAAPFRHRCLVLVGAQGIGRRSIKNRLIQMSSAEFGAPTPNTSRAMRDGEVPGRNYHFLTRREMESDIKAGKYLEYGELNGNYYGTSLSALKIVIDSGRTCIIDPKSAVSTVCRTTALSSSLLQCCSAYVGIISESLFLR